MLKSTTSGGGAARSSEKRNRKRANGSLFQSILNGGALAESDGPPVETSLMPPTPLEMFFIGNRSLQTYIAVYQRVKSIMPKQLLSRDN